MRRDCMTLPLALADEIVVDNFAGGGGASTGIEMALGRGVNIAINHDPEAIAMHRHNHPGTIHLCESVFKIDPEAVTGNQPVGLAWFSPDCTHHSKAKGGAPRSPRLRGLAWVVIRWARRVKPRVIMLENVEEFAEWGPLTQDGKPCPLRKGKTFTLWLNQLRRFGYHVEYRELRASDYGAPTTRKRLFVIARRDGLPIVWPNPTHGPAGSGLLPYRTAAECIDWTLPCPSIFERARPLAENTQRRIARGIMKYVVNAAEPFIVPLTHTGDARVHPLAEPMRTLTTANRGELALCTPYLVDPAHGEVSPSGVRRWGDGARSLDNPLNTVCASGGSAALVAPTLIQTGYGERPRMWRCGACGFTYDAGDLPTCGCVKCGSLEDPLAIAAQAPRVPGLDKPLGTVVAGGQKHALVTAFLAKHYGDSGQRPGITLSEPVATITAADHHALVTAHLMTNTTGHSGSAVEQPLPTITTGNHQALVTAHIAKLRGTNIGHEAGEPLQTISAHGTHFAEVRALLLKFYGTEQDPRLTEPMHTVTTRDRFGLVTVHGEQYAIADIGMRMLQPRELYRAQGFPDSYVIEFQHNGKPLSKAAQVRMCGNSVCPPIAAALVAANFAHEAAINVRRAA